jgi:hypothetical protein
MALPKKNVPELEIVNLGDESIYTGGFTIPEGIYTWKDVSVVMHAGFKENSNQKARLGVMITLVPEDAPTEEKKQFYSFGSNADKSFAPNPHTGKSVVLVPGAVGNTLPDSTNWNVLRKSLMDSGLPSGVFVGDFSVFIGLRAHMVSVSEPEERKGFAQSQTGEAQAEPRRTNQIAIVTEILHGPWDGEEVKKPATTAKPLAKPAAKKVEPEPEPEETATDDDVKAVAVAAISDVLEKEPEGTLKLKARTTAFGIIKKKHGDDAAQAATEQFFSNDNAFNSILGELGYKVAGPKIVPA